MSHAMKITSVSHMDTIKYRAIIQNNKKVLNIHRQILWKGGYSSVNFDLLKQLSSQD